MYTKEALKRFKNPKFAGELKKPDAVGKVGNINCGDIIKVEIKVENNRIKNIKFKTYGCIAAISASDVLCEMAKGKTLDKAMKITTKDIIKKLGDLPPIKYHCSMMGIQALKKAIEGYRKKQK